MGGRAAEELIFGKDKVTGGASSDLNGATGVAEAMVKKLAMSDNLGMKFRFGKCIFCSGKTKFFRSW